MESDICWRGCRSPGEENIMAPKSKVFLLAENAAQIWTENATQISGQIASDSLCNFSSKYLETNKIYITSKRDKFINFNSSISTFHQL